MGRKTKMKKARIPALITDEHCLLRDLSIMLSLHINDIDFIK